MKRANLDRMADLNDTEAARVALEQTWFRLAPIVDEARHAQEEAARNPSILRDPSVEAQTRWLFVFDRELAAVQTVFEAARGGGKLSSDELHAAREAGEKLFGIISEAQERAPQPV
jgi:hypothetical protein